MFYTNPPFTEPFRKTLLFQIIFCALILSSESAIALRLPRGMLLNNSLTHYSKRNIEFKVIHEKKHSPLNSLKYILLWTEVEEPKSYYPYVLGFGIRPSECTLVNCYYTDNKNFFDGDLTRFHAVVFNGCVIKRLKLKDLPKVRSPHQKYIYANSESADNHPIKKPFYDDYFNWTYTYRLDSDVIYPYFMIKNKKGEIIGPKNNMEWDEIDKNNNDSKVEIKIDSKKKTAAWFASNCNTLSGREFFIEELNQALKKYGLNVDRYGKCGDLECPKHTPKECNAMLRRDYYFYMALENSFAKDYVTEKVVTAFNNDMIPIVWGGANYSKFLPPNSYIDARKMKPTHLAATMYDLMNNIPLYLKYFEWKKYYTYEIGNSNVCSFCDILNDEAKFKTYSTYKDIRKWWNEHNNELKDPIL